MGCMQRACSFKQSVDFDSGKHICTGYGYSTKFSSLLHHSGSEFKIQLTTSVLYGRCPPSPERHSLQCLLRRPYSHTDDPPHDPSLQSHFTRSCLHSADPPHFLHAFLCRPCSHILDPPQSLQSVLTRPCWHTPFPPHSLHLYFRHPCKQNANRATAFFAMGPLAAVLTNPTAAAVLAAVLRPSVHAQRSPSAVLA